MGAEYFENYREGTDLQTTFDAALARAQWDHGHAGYSGTLAEKREVLLRHEEPLSYDKAVDFAEDDLADNDHDKWGPAWAVRVKDDKHDGFLFYGYASS